MPLFIQYIAFLTTLEIPSTNIQNLPQGTYIIQKDVQATLQSTKRLRYGLVFQLPSANACNTNSAVILVALA